MGLRFDWTLNVGYVFVVVAALGGGLSALAANNVQVATIDTRTADYPRVRDLVLADATRLDALTAAIAAQSISNEAIMRSLAAVREDLAAIRATLAARGSP